MKGFGQSGGYIRSMQCICSCKHTPGRLSYFYTAIITMNCVYVAVYISSYVLQLLWLLQHMGPFHPWKQRKQKCQCTYRLLRKYAQGKADIFLVFSQRFALTLLVSQICKRCQHVTRSVCILLDVIRYNNVKLTSHLVFCNVNCVIIMLSVDFIWNYNIVNKDYLIPISNNDRTVLFL